MPSWVLVEIKGGRLLVKSAYRRNSFLISPPKHMLWVLKRTFSMRRLLKGSFELPNIYVNTNVQANIYNHTATNLAIYSNETSQDKLSEAYNRLPILVIEVPDKLHEKLFIFLCWFLWINESGWEFVFSKSLWFKSHLLKRHMCRYALEFPHRGNSNVYLQHISLQIRKKTIWKLTFYK